MGNGPAIFGKFGVRTTAELALAIEAGTVGPVEMGLLQGVWEKEVNDPDLMTVLSVIDTNPQMRDVVARLLQDPIRSGYWPIARGRLGHLQAFAPKGEVVQQVKLALERRRLAQQAQLPATGRGTLSASSAGGRKRTGGKPEQNWEWLKGFAPEAREEVRNLFQEFDERELREGLINLGRMASEGDFVLHSPDAFLKRAIRLYGLKTAGEIFSENVEVIRIFFDENDAPFEVPKELLLKWINSWISSPESLEADEEENFDWTALRELSDEVEEKLGKLIDRWQKAHPIINVWIEDFIFLGGVFVFVSINSEDLFEIMDELDFLLRRLEKFGIEPGEVERIRDNIKEFYDLKPSIKSKNHPLRLLAIASREAKSKGEMEGFLEAPAGKLRERFGEVEGVSWGDLFSVSPAHKARMVLVEKENPQGRKYSYRRLVELAHQGEASLRRYLDALPQNKFVAERLKDLDIDPAQHRAGIGEREVAGKGEVLTPEKRHELKTQKTIGAWKILMERGALKRPERLRAKLKDTLFKGESVEVKDPESVQQLLLSKPEQLKPFIQTVIEFGSKKDNVANPTRTNEALLILRRIGQTPSEQKGTEITVRFQVEKKHPVYDLTIGNDSGCCIGVYLAVGEEELSNGVYMPFYLSDDATHFVGIYLGKRRVGMALVFDGILGDRPAMLINSIELGNEFEEGDPRVSVVVRGVHEYMQAWAKRDGTVLVESMHDYNTGFIYEKNRGVAYDEEVFEKFHQSGEFYSDSLDESGRQGEETNIRLLYDPVKEVKVSREAVSIDALIEAEDWNAVRERLGTMVALQRQYAKDKAAADEAFLQSMEVKSREMDDAKRASKFLKIVLEVLGLQRQF